MTLQPCASSTKKKQVSASSVQETWNRQFWIQVPSLHLMGFFDTSQFHLKIPFKSTYFSPFLAATPLSGVAHCPRDKIHAPCPCSSHPKSRILPASPPSAHWGFLSAKHRGLVCLATRRPGTEPQLHLKSWHAFAAPKATVPKPKSVTKITHLEHTQNLPCCHAGLHSLTTRLHFCLPWLSSNELKSPPWLGAWSQQDGMWPQAQREGHVRTRWEGGRLQVKERHLGGNQPCSHLHLRLLASRARIEYFSIA